jgi:3-methyladenine DNA glycosylase AlkD
MPMKPEELYDEIVTFCKSNTDEAIIKKYSRYFKGGQYDAYGLALNIIENKVKEILENKNIDLAVIRETSRLLVRNPKYEGVSFAYLFYKSFLKQFDRWTFTDIIIWFETGISNWAHCDVICGELIFPLLKKNIITPMDLIPWITASNKFQRRAVPVSLIKTLKTTNDFLPYFNIIEPLMTDHDREVHQGVGWFLREAWKKEKEQTESFLLKYKDISPRLIFQYACEKMNVDEKIRFKRTKL